LRTVVAVGILLALGLASLINALVSRPAHPDAMVLDLRTFLYASAVALAVWIERLGVLRDVAPGKRPRLALIGRITLPSSVEFVYLVLILSFVAIWLQVAGVTLSGKPFTNLLTMGSLYEKTPVGSKCDRTRI
jgi:hypothetical protein